MKIEIVLVLLIIGVSGTRVHNRNKVHLGAKSHLHNRNRLLSRSSTHKKYLEPSATDGPLAAVNNTKKIEDAQKVDPVLSKAYTGLYPFYPDKFNISNETQPMIMFTQDTNSKGESLLNRHDLDYEEKCVLKQGYLAQVLSFKNDQQFVKDEQGTIGTQRKFFTMRPVFTVLNKQTLSIFENENVKGLLLSIPLTKIASSCQYQNWTDTFCWSVVGNNNQILPGGDPTKDQSTFPTEVAKDQPVMLTLCSTLSSVRDSWAKAINEFHNCEVQKVSVVEQNKQDFMRTIKDQDEDFDEERNNASDEQILEIGDSLEAINDKVRSNLNIITQEEQNADNTIADEENKIDELEDKNECLQEQLIEDSLQSAQDLEWDLQKAMTDKVKKSINPDKLNDLYKNRLYRILQHKKNQIKDRKRVENNINDEMMSKVKQVSKYTDPSACYSQAIIDKGNVARKEVCSAIYKDMGYTLIIKDLIDCLNENTFCMACCSNFIGTAKLEKRNQCVGRCANAQKANIDKTQLKLIAETKNALSSNELHVNQTLITDLEKS